MVVRSTSPFRTATPKIAMSPVEVDAERGSPRSYRARIRRIEGGTIRRGRDIACSWPSTFPPWTMRDLGRSRDPDHGLDTRRRGGGGRHRASGIAAHLDAASRMPRHPARDAPCAPADAECSHAVPLLYRPRRGVGGSVCLTRARDARGTQNGRALAPRNAISHGARVTASAERGLRSVSCLRQSARCCADGAPTHRMAGSGRPCRRHG